jgi:cell division cycle 2-like
MLSSEHSRENSEESGSDTKSSKNDSESDFEMSPIEQLEKSDRRRKKLRKSESKSKSKSRSRSKTKSRSSSSSRSRSDSSKSSQTATNSEESASEESDDEKKKVEESKKSTPEKVEEITKVQEEEKVEEKPIEEEKEEELPPFYPALQGCRSVEEFQCLNRIEEGTYGVVYRARDKRTNEVVALKRLKMEKEKEGFPITSLREINTLLKGQHPNIVTVREIVVGSNMDKIFIVMDYVEHDLKSLMETMKHKKQTFLPGEVKCLIQQLLRAVAHLHDNWILHRDLKTSNLLLSHKGILKVGDFGLAREYGSPLKEYTSIVVTLWYRAPELLLGCREYSTPIDVWSCGCIFGELLTMNALFPGKSEVDQLNKIFKDLGTPNERIWPNYDQLPLVKKMTFTEYPVSQIRKKYPNHTTDLGWSMLFGLLTYDPSQRLTAEAALKHPYFKELPLPIDPSMFPTWPAKSEVGWKRAIATSPKPPSGGTQFKKLVSVQFIIDINELFNLFIFDYFTGS